MRFHGRVYFERFYAKKEAAYLRKYKYSDPKEAKLKFFHLYNDKKRLIDALPFYEYMFSGNLICDAEINMLY